MHGWGTTLTWDMTRLWRGKQTSSASTIQRQVMQRSIRNKISFSFWHKSHHISRRLYSSRSRSSWANECEISIWTAEMRLFFSSFISTFSFCFERFKHLYSQAELLLTFKSMKSWQKLTNDFLKLKFNETPASYASLILY